MKSNTRNNLDELATKLQQQYQNSPSIQYHDMNLNLMQQMQVMKSTMNYNFEAAICQYHNDHYPWNHSIDQFMDQFTEQSFEFIDPHYQFLNPCYKHMDSYSQRMHFHHQNMWYPCHPNMHQTNIIIKV